MGASAANRHEPRSLSENGVQLAPSPHTCCSNHTQKTKHNDTKTNNLRGQRRDAPLSGRFLLRIPAPFRYSLPMHGGATSGLDSAGEGGAHAKATTARRRAACPKKQPVPPPRPIAPRRARSCGGSDQQPSVRRTTFLFLFW